VLSVSIALTASLWFWLPALLEKKDIVLDGANVNQALIQHFPTLQQLVWSPVSFGFSNPGSIDTLSFSVGTLSILGWLICMLSILKVTSLRKKIRLNTLLVSTLTLLLVLFLAMLALTQKFWGTIPFVSYIQFPWRLGSIILIFSGVVLAHAYALSNQILRSLIFCTAVVLLIAAVRLKAVDTFHRTNVDYEAFSQSTSTNNENLPKSFNYSNIANWQPSASVLSGDATTSTTSWSGSSRYYVVEVKNLSVIVEPTMYFPGWMTAVVDLNSNKKFNVSYLDSSEIGGRIAYSLEPGTYQIKSYFTQNTWPRMIGNGVSLAAILVWLVVIIFWKKLHKNLV